MAETKTDRKQKVLDELRKHGNFSRAARRVNINRRTIFGWRQRDKVFESAVKEALREALE